MKQETSSLGQIIVKVFAGLLSAFMVAITLFNYGKDQFWPLLIATAIALIVAIFIFICLK